MRFRASVQSVNRFNTQPPEGGWGDSINISTRRTCFNTQPPEGGWYGSWLWQCLARLVSTHSRPKAAGLHDWALITHQMFQHTAARRRLGRNRDSGIRPIGFNTQPPEGGWSRARRRGCFWLSVSTHSRPKAAGVGIKVFRHTDVGFQHTAARRRLGSPFQHICVRHSFNTQPPEGGWQMISNN